MTQNSDLKLIICPCRVLENKKNAVDTTSNHTRVNQSLTFDNCCLAIHKNHGFAKTAEQLMRARYSAFVVGNIDFIEKTHDPKTLSKIDLKDTEEWSKKSQWHGLQIHSAEKGTENCVTGTVDFTAHFDLGNGKEQHREKSLFNKIEGLWFYTDSLRTAPSNEEIATQTHTDYQLAKLRPKIGRNDPCHCGSGKKYKKCCSQA